MIERVIENWLIRVNERSLEIPFCQLLTSEGYQVVHLSRHGSFEQGKDVIAISPEGIPCAFQLKGSGERITQRAWGPNYLDQVIRLVEIPIKHPSIDPKLPRHVYFVTNGELDEEVRVEIEDRNQDWEQRGHPRLQTIVRGQLLTRFLNSTARFWPTELVFERELLELYLADGRGNLAKPRMANFIARLLPLSNERLNKAECSRNLASAAIIVAYALSPYEETANHVAIFEGWVIYTAHLVALVEKFDLEENYWSDSLNLAMIAIEKSLMDLYAELKERSHLVEGDPMVDHPFYRGRVTWLVSLMSALVIWKSFRHEEVHRDLVDWVKEFVSHQWSELLFWGEGAVPQFLTAIWFSLITSNNAESINMIGNLIHYLTVFNAYDSDDLVGLPDPYCEFSEIVEDNFGLKNSPRRMAYKGQSYTIEALIHLLAKRSWRQKLKWLWPQITKVTFIQFRPQTKWEYCLWHLETGTTETKQPHMPQSWETLRDESRRVESLEIPSLFHAQPELLLMFIIVYPHRFNTEVAKYLDDCFSETRKYFKQQVTD